MMHFLLPSQMNVLQLVLNELASAMDTIKISNCISFDKTVRVIDNLAGSDRVMNESLFVGTYLSLRPEILVHIVNSIRRAVAV